MLTSLYTKIDADSLGLDADQIEAYTAFAQHALQDLYPEAHIKIESTMHESGAMPLVIEGDSRAEREDATEELRRCWERWGTLHLATHAPRSNHVALGTFMAQIVRLKAVLATLNAYAENGVLDEAAPEDIHWGHVGTVAGLATALENAIGQYMDFDAE